MKQQINLYQDAMRRKQPAFSAIAMASGIVVCLMALGGGWFLAEAHAGKLTAELQAVQAQEAAAAERLDRLTRTFAVRKDSNGVAGTLKDALSALEQRERLLALVDGQGLGESAGFSGPLRALAQHSVDGLWLTRIRVTAPGMRTRLEGRAVAPSLVPEYLLGLATQDALSGQRFDQFNIERPDKESSAPVRFSMTSERAEQFSHAGARP